MFDSIIDQEVPFKVKCIDKDEKPADFFNTDSPKGLRKGKIYTVINIDVHDWHTELELEGVDGWFNSVHFELVEEKQ